MAFLPTSIQRVVDEGYDFNMGEYLNRGWQLVQKNMGNFVAFTLVYFIIQILLTFIPIIGTLAGLIINPAIAVGPFIVADKLSRDETASFNDFFKGFDKFGNLFLVTILQGLVILAACIPGIAMILMGGVSMFSMDAPPEMGTMFWLGILVAMIPAIYLGVSYSLSSQFVWFNNLGAWDAMEASRKVVGKNWGAFLGFFIVLGLIAIGGAIVLLVGLLFAVPLIWCALYTAFATITGRDKEEGDSQSDIADHLITH